MDQFLLACSKACGVSDISGSSLVDEVILDDLSRAELLEALGSDQLKLKESDLSLGAGATLADLYEVLQKKGLKQEKLETTASKRENLYFKRLLQGVDVSIKPTNPMKQMLFQFAKQMKNFSYVIGDKVRFFYVSKRFSQVLVQATKEVMVVDACWDVDGILGFIKSEGLTCVGAICTHFVSREKDKEKFVLFDL